MAKKIYNEDSFIPLLYTLSIFFFGAPASVVVGGRTVCPPSVNRKTPPINLPAIVMVRTHTIKVSRLTMVKRERSSSAKKDRKRSKSENADKNGTSAVEEEAVKRQASNQQEQQEDVKPKINSNKKKAKKLGHSNGTLFFRKRIELAVSLLPGSLRNCQEAVEDSIRGLLMKYSEGLGGIMMGYENVKLIGNKKGQGRGWILNELPYIHYNASCDALVFHPSIGYEVRFCPANWLG